MQTRMGGTFPRPLKFAHPLFNLYKALFAERKGLCGETISAESNQ